MLKKTIGIGLLSAFSVILIPHQVNAVTYGEPVPNAAVDFPEVISVWSDGQDGNIYHRCTAVLIEQQVAVTAAHCVQGVDVDLYVEVGANKLGEGRTVYVSATWYNPRYSNRRIANDIALLHLAEPANVSRTARLTRGVKFTKKSRLRIAGWGVDQNGDYLNELHQLKVKFDNDGAKRAYGRSFNARTTLGAGRYFRSERVYGGACNGDSGGPLYEGRIGARPRLVGIVSYGLEGCDEDAPTVFARVDYYWKTLKKGIKTLKSRAAEREAAIASTPLTASFTFVMQPYYYLRYWDAIVSASTVSFAGIHSWCFFINGRAATKSEIVWGSGDMPFFSDTDACFRRSALESDSMTSGEVEFNLNGLGSGPHTIHAVVTDSLGRSVTTNPILFSN